MGRGPIWHTCRSVATHRFALVLHPRRDVSEVVASVVRWAQPHGAEVLVESADAHRVGAGVRAVEADELSRSCDAVVSIGGDGTMLGALRLVATAAGSSAYSYAAGGPLLSPSVRGIVVTPSAAMSASRGPSR